MEWGQGRIEVIALKTEIIEMLKEGCSIRTIYQTFHKSGRIKISEPGFYAQVKKQITQTDRLSESIPLQQKQEPPENSTSGNGYEDFDINDFFKEVPKQ